MSLLFPFPFWVTAEQKMWPGLRLVYRWLSLGMDSSPALAYLC